MNSAQKKYLIAVLSICLLCFLISRFLFQLCLVSGESMDPSLKNGQIVALNKLPSGKNLTRGQLAVFSSRRLKTVMIKRVVGIPGDTVRIVDGTLLVNDEAVSFPDHDEAILYAGLADDPLTLNEDEYFIMGDNYNHSIDSRSEQIGPVSADELLGAVILPRK